MDPKGSSTHGKKSKKAKERWDNVAEAVYDILTIDEFPETELFKDVDDDDKLAAYQIADALIRLVDNLVVPALKKGMK